MDVYEFYNLGIGEPIPISAANRMGLGDMLDEIVKEFPEDTTQEEEDEIPKIAIVGQPVSYTHLDVYKRQLWETGFFWIKFPTSFLRLREGISSCLKQMQAMMRLFISEG